MPSISPDWIVRDARNTSSRPAGSSSKEQRAASLGAVLTARASRVRMASESRQSRSGSQSSSTSRRDRLQPCAVVVVVVAAAVTIGDLQDADRRGRAGTEAPTAGCGS